MNSRRVSLVFSVLSVLLYSVVAAGPAHAQGTAFTYQGELKDNGGLANGAYDMDFSLWDAVSAGSQIGSTVMVDGVQVNEGKFAVELDFGASAFDNGNRWLEIAVDGFMLDPRQKITRSPYAIQTRGIFVDDVGNVGIGTDAPQGTFDVAGSIRSSGPDGGAFIARNPNNQQASVGLGWRNDVARIRVGGNGAGASGGLDVQTVGDRSLLRILHGGQVGIGTTSPGAKLDIRGSDADLRLSAVNDRFGPELQFRNTLSANSLHGRIEFQDQNGNVLSNIGYANPLIGPRGLSFQTANGGVMKMTDDGNVGIGTLSPGAPLHVEGGTDTAPSQGGFLVLGNTGSANISIDNNEIMARNNGATSTLFLNNNGGAIVCGGPIDIDYTIVSGSSSVSCPGGTKVLGGGCRISGDAEVRRSYPSNNGWQCEAGDVVGFISLTAYAICANVK